MYLTGPVFFLVKNFYAYGSVGLSIRIHKLGFDTIGHVLFILTPCLTTCEFPASWKHSIVHSIPKSGIPPEDSNFVPIYRPGFC